ncbi:MAG TPA: GNAT family N-acetyltransferase [Candidatus Limnocylindrales bacterium]|nr:GNAT family N-acetyltransferase [Candidatus Limnocylindrales bacterium]
MQPRPIDMHRDMPGVADLLGRTRAGGGLTHPGGIQWWLRGLGMDGFEDLGAYVWAADDGELGGFALVDGDFVVIERIDGGPSTLEQVAWLEREMRSKGRAAIEFHVAERDPVRGELEARGYRENGKELELVADVAAEPERAPLPDGFRMGSLLDVTDDAYVSGHVAAWSDTKPSSYRRELHDAVTSMPQFRPDLVTVAIAPDGRVAACTIGWLDDRSKTLEIEPLGTDRDFRRLGFGHAIVKEVQHRAWANGATRVLVWNQRESNEAAYGLYTGAGMPINRTLVLLRKVF